MVTKIIAIGCSFTFGYEIDQPKNNDVSKFLDRTYTGLLAKHFGVDFQIYARPGAGNRDISVVAQEAMYKHRNEDCLYICFWSGTDRASYIINDHKPNSDSYTISGGLVKYLKQYPEMYPDHPARKNQYMMDLYTMHHGIKQQVYDGLVWFSGVHNYAKLNNHKLLHIHMLRSMDWKLDLFEQQVLPGKNWRTRYTEQGKLPTALNTSLVNTYSNTKRWFTEKGLLSIVHGEDNVRYRNGDHLNFEGHQRASELILERTNINELINTSINKQG